QGRQSAGWRFGHSATRLARLEDVDEQGGEDRHEEDRRAPAAHAHPPRRRRASTAAITAKRTPGRTTLFQKMTRPSREDKARGDNVPPGRAAGRAPASGSARAGGSARARKRTRFP